MIICPKCNTENAPEYRRCRQCRADLLPGEGIGQRLGVLAITLLISLFGGYILYRLYLANTWPKEVECMLLSPAFWGLMVLVLPFFGLYYALRPTPLHSRFLERARRHARLDARQAVEDFNQALMLAPDKERAGILKARADFFQKLGNADHAALDRLNATLETGSYQGTEAAAALLGVDSDIMVDGARSAEQAKLLKESQVIPLGYCSKCRRVVPLNEKIRCLAHPRIKAEEVRFTLPKDVPAVSAAIEQQHKDKVRNLKRRRIVGYASALVGFGLILYMINKDQIKVPETTIPEAKDAGQTAVAPLGTAAFDEYGFHFEYPADWQVITTADHDVLLNGTLKGLRDYDYLGGVYFKGLDNCSGCAQVVIVAFQDPSLPGGLTEEQFTAAKEATQDQMGDRLISYEYVSIDSLPAAESKHYGRSGDSQLWEYMILPPEPGVAFSFSMSADKSSYSRFEPIFSALVDSLLIEAGQPSE